MKKLYLISILSVLTQCSCTGFVMNEKITGNYRLVAVDDEQQTCICYTEPGDRQGCSPVIMETVYALGFNKDFIIAKQHPSGRQIITNYFILLVNNKQKHQENNSGLIGPLTFDQFQKARGELGVPDSLKFTTVKSN